MFLPSQALQGLLQGVVAGNAKTASTAARTMKSLQQGNNKSSAAVARSGVTFSAKLPGKFSLLLTLTLGPPCGGCCFGILCYKCIDPRKHFKF